MIKIKIYTIGKLKKRWLIEAIDDYTSRLQHQFAIQWVLVKTPTKLKLALEKEARFIALDPKGNLLPSLAFSNLMATEWRCYGAKLAFLIGGADGVEPSLLSLATHQISLSPLTFTHQMTRLILLEQLYRSSQIVANTPYHK
ncbi:MAG: 23S rRNA (pseudouridine(1915)-N(3))-methyltransferase RlmH [Chlamydiota bacterium]